VVIYDKNTTTVSGGKKVDEDTYSIGDTVKYTATFNTTNWLGEGANAEQVTKYVISDTLPEFLSDVKITSVKIISTPDDPETTETDETVVAADLSSSYTAFTDKQITITWADIDTTTTPATVTSRYPNGAIIEIKYEGTLTSVTNINTADTNTVDIQPYVWRDNNEKPWEEHWSYDEEIKTYAAALKKTDGAYPLKGAQFTIKGLTVTGEKGEYTVVSYNPAADAAESATLDTNDDGILYIIGLASDVKLTVTEVKAPDGYNKLTTPIEVTPQLLTTALYKASGDIYYDAKGNVVSQSSQATSTVAVEKNLTDLVPEAVEVVNNAGTELPSTGGIGTTIFYTVGGILVVAALVLLVTKKRMSE
jgi:LPXTG-motif cell wall-anchored protein